MDATKETSRASSIEDIESVLRFDGELGGYRVRVDVECVRPSLAVAAVVTALRGEDVTVGPAIGEDVDADALDTVVWTGSESTAVLVTVGGYECVVGGSGRIVARSVGERE